MTKKNSIRWERVEPGHYAGICDELGVTFVTKRESTGLSENRWTARVRWHAVTEDVKNQQRFRTLVDAQSACTSWTKPGTRA